jgi:putative endonuclease
MWPWSRLFGWLPGRRRPHTLGLRGEALAERFLRRRGYKIVARGHRDLLGELDLVAIQGRTIVFVEVKTRRSARYGHPAEAIDSAKQRRITQAALRFLRKHDLLEQRSRFDVLAITWPTGRRPRVEHFPGAFDAHGNGPLFG